VGLALGSLDAAAVYTRDHARPWTLSDVATAADDPYVLAGYGELLATARAAGHTVDAAVAALGAAGSVAVAFGSAFDGQGMHRSSAYGVPVPTPLRAPARR
jgi:hypothetical protein